MTERPFLRRTALEWINSILSNAVLSLWPEENKAWGIAFTSELQAIESPQMQFRWLLSGIPVLLRETLNSFLRSLGRPVGVSPSDVVSEGSPHNGRSPRTPRLLLAFLLLLVVVLFAQSPTRAIFRSVSQAYTAEGWDTSHWPEVQRIQSLAEKALAAKNPDAQLLAFASLTFSEENKRLAFADAAIYADPQLTWIDYQNAILPWDDITHRHTLSADRMARLQSADPDNALLHLLRAAFITLQYQQEDAKNDPGAHHVATWGAAARRDPRWLAAMDAAFHAPQFDPYDSRLFELSRQVVQRYSINDPRLLFSVLGRRPIGLYSETSEYRKILLAQAADAQRNGNTESAIQTCSLILNFAKHLRAGNFYQLEGAIANDLESDSYSVLQAAYESSGRHQEALAIVTRLQQNRDARMAYISRHVRKPQTFPLHWSRSEWAALLMQSSVFAIWIFLPLSLASIVLLWFWRSRLRVRSGLFHSLLCLFADFCPFLLALATVILFFTYAPYHHAYLQTLQAPFSPASYQEFTTTAFAPFYLPPAVSGPNGLFLLWSALSVVLTLLAFMFTWRFFRKSSTPQQQ